MQCHYWPKETELHFIDCVMIQFLELLLYLDIARCLLCSSCRLLLCAPHNYDLVISSDTLPTLEFTPQLSLPSTYPPVSLYIYTSVATY